MDSGSCFTSFPGEVLDLAANQEADAFFIGWFESTTETASNGESTGE
jgi:hypothetical protein